MASSYRKYSDLGVTQAEKQQQQLAQIRAMEAQKTIEEQQQRLQEQEAKIHKMQEGMQKIQQQQQQHQRIRQQQQRIRQQQNSYNGPACPQCKTLDEKKKLIWGNKICVFKISAPWCGPCKEIAPRYDALAKLVNSPGKCVLAAEELDDKLSLNVEGVPAFDFYYDRKRVHRLLGADFNKFQLILRSLMKTGKLPESLDSHPASGMQPSRPVEKPSTRPIPPSAIKM